MGLEFKLPDIGEGVVEGEIVKWLVSAGDAVDVDQPMVEVMTDKATVVIPSPTKGTVKETRGAEGDIVEVGAVLVVIDDGVTTASEPGAGSAASPGADAASASTSSAGSGVASGPDAASGSEPAPAPARGRPSAELGDPPPAPGSGVLAAPATRRLAREVGVDIGTVRGTGPAGRVTSEDVRAASTAEASSARSTAAPASARSRPAPPPPPASSRVDEVIPVRGLRGKIWDAMTRSAFSAPHFTFVEECDVTELVSYRKRLNALLADDEPRLTFMPFLVKAVCAALRDFPQLNGQVNDDDRSFVQRADKHLGIAVASPRGLTVPVLRHADRRSLVEIAEEVKRLADAVREGTIGTADLGGSTFTITSLGKQGGLFATPIINYPEVAIMGVHRLQKRPMVQDDDSIVVRSMMNLSLSFDHRLIDGHVGAEFTYRVIEILENPDRLVLEMI